MGKGPWRGRAGGADAPVVLLLGVVGVVLVVGGGVARDNTGIVGEMGGGAPLVGVRTVGLTLPFGTSA